LSNEFGCCPSAQPYSCAQTSLCYASADQAFADCGGDAGIGCSTGDPNWCLAPPDIGSCLTPGQLYCGNSYCCDPSRPWFCNSDDGGALCYTTQALAQTACGGNSCAYCSPTCPASTTSGLCDGGLTCGNACCDPSTPFYCAVNAGAGYCFVSNAEAYQFCQSIGNVCTTCAP
jgi:hypothetical protein